MPVRLFERGWPHRCGIVCCHGEGCGLGEELREQTGVRGNGTNVSSIPCFRVNATTASVIDGFCCEWSSTVWTRQSAAHLRECCPVQEGVGSGPGAPIYSWLLVGGDGGASFIEMCLFLHSRCVSVSWTFILPLWRIPPRAFYGGHVCSIACTRLMIIF